MLRSTPSHERPSGAVAGSMNATRSHGARPAGGQPSVQSPRRPTGGNGSKSFAETAAVHDARRAGSGIAVALSSTPAVQGARRDSNEGFVSPMTEVAAEHGMTAMALVRPVAAVRAALLAGQGRDGADERVGAGESMSGRVRQLARPCPKLASRTSATILLVMRQRTKTRDGMSTPRGRSLEARVAQVATAGRADLRTVWPRCWLRRRDEQEVGRGMQREAATRTGEKAVVVAAAAAGRLGVVLPVRRVPGVGR